MNDQPDLTYDAADPPDSPDSPDSPDPSHTPDRPGWPVAIGIIAIVFGGLGLLAGCVNIVFMSFIETFINMLADAAGQPAESMGLAGVLAYKGWITVLAVATVLVALPLLLGGIALARRRPSSRPLLLFWSVAKILFVIGNSVLTLAVNRAQFEASQTNPELAGVSAEISRVTSDVFMALGALWGWALPVFLIIWFSRRKVKDEMATWAGAAGGHSWSDAGDALPR